MIRRMRIACWITKTTDRHTHTHTHSKYVILFSFPRQLVTRTRIKSYVKRSRWHFAVRFVSDLGSSVLPCADVRMGQPALTGCSRHNCQRRRALVSVLMRQILSAEVCIVPSGQALKSAQRFVTIIKVSYLPTHPPTYLHTYLLPTHPYLQPTYEVVLTSP